MSEPQGAAYVTARLRQGGEYLKIDDQLPYWVSHTLDLLDSYLKTLGEDAETFDEDDAYEVIVDTLVDEHRPDESTEMMLASLVSDILTYYEIFLENNK